ncbi:hypothetical protein M378DRAFT_1045027, partial [Amanita muscaria Koide BX008]
MSSTKDFADQVPIFHGSGWITWEPIMKAFLRTKGVWKYIDGSATMPTLGVIMDLEEAPEPPTMKEPIEPADFDEGNDKALGFLSIKISRSLYHLLTESASESWTILRDQFSKTGAAQLYLDWIKLKEFYMSSSKPPADQISHLRSLLDR